MHVFRAEEENFKTEIKTHSQSTENFIVLKCFAAYLKYVLSFKLVHRQIYGVVGGGGGGGGCGVRPSF